MAEGGLSKRASRQWISQATEALTRSRRVSPGDRTARILSSVPLGNLAPMASGQRSGRPDFRVPFSLAMFGSLCDTGMEINGHKLMRFDLRTPCKNCPFRTDATAIRFACRERAEEIEESAYRHGFPCHLSAKFTGDDDEDGGFVFGENTQHCAGALIMYAKDSGGNIPFENLSGHRQDAILTRMDWNAPVFDSERDFLDSYGPELAEAL